MPIPTSNENDARPDAEPDAASESAFRAALRRRSNWIGLFIVFLAGTAAIILVVGNISAIGSFSALLLNVNPWWFAAAFVSQLATYACTALVWARVLRRAGYRLNFLSLYTLSVGKLFADQAVPSGGLSGAGFLFHAFSKRQIPYKTAFSTFVFVSLAYIFAFLLAATISFVALAVAGETSPRLASSITIFAAVLASIIIISFVAVVVTPSNSPSWLNRIRLFRQARSWLELAMKQMVSQKILFFEVMGLQFSIRLIDGITVYLAFLAIGDAVPLHVCFYAAIIGSVVSTIGLVPMGVGTYEAGMVSTLKIFGVPVQEALAASLIFRGLTLWLPLLPGFIIIQREILREKINTVDADQFETSQIR